MVKPLTVKILMIQTLYNIVQKCAQQFIQAKLYFGHGTSNAEDEALALALYALGQYEIETYEKHLPKLLDQPLTNAQQQAILQLVERRIMERLPLPYITHKTWFAGLPFYVDERVIVPRSPIAELISSNFSPWLQHKTSLRIMDMCTGSGCIAIACAKTFPDARIDAVDISAEALEVAKINVHSHQVTHQVQLIQSDLFCKIPAEHQYDLIIVNPPYVDAAEMASLPKEYKHEPDLALAAGEDGLDLVRILLKEVQSYLKPKGVLVVEVGDSETAMKKAFPHLPLYWLDFKYGGSGVFVLLAPFS